MGKFSKVMDQFGEECQWMRESAEYLEQLTEKAVKMQKQIDKITSNFPSSSRSARVKLPGHCSDIHSSSKKLSKLTRTKKSRSKINGENLKGTTQ